MGITLNYTNGQTPIDEEELLELKVRITTQGELNEWEQLNIEESLLWAIGLKINTPQELVNELFIRSLHRRMYGKVWKWAGSFRKTNKNIGVDKTEIAVRLRMLCQDFLYWHEHDIYSIEERVLRLKHLLVSIHCFPNGNGRHSRMMADLVVSKIYGKKPFEWGSSDNLVAASEHRRKYIEALKKADLGQYEPLIRLVTS